MSFAAALADASALTACAVFGLNLEASLLAPGGGEGAACKTGSMSDGWGGSGGERRRGGGFRSAPCWSWRGAWAEPGGESRLGGRGEGERRLGGRSPGESTSIEDGREGDMRRGLPLGGVLARGEGLSPGLLAAPSGDIIRGEDGALFGVPGTI